MEVFILRVGKGEGNNRQGPEKYTESTENRYSTHRGSGFLASYSLIGAGCWSICLEKSTVSLAGSVGSGRKRKPQIEHAYSPVHTRLPSRFVITALRQIFLAGIVKAYTDFTDSIGEKVSN